MAGILNMDKNIESAAEDFARQIYDGKLHSRQIHFGMYNETAGRLIDAVMGSFGNAFGYDSPANAALDFMQSNIFAFSAAKSMTEFEEFSRLLVEDGERIPSFNQFKKKIQSLNIKFNERYLAAEYTSAIAQGQMASKWMDFLQNQDAGEYLEYRTAGDERVRQSHKILDGKVFHKDDEILKRIYPPNDWGCRCTMIQVDAPSRRTPPSMFRQLEKSAKIPKYFRNNVGMTGMVYMNGHPYFKGIGKMTQLKAMQNYNLWDPNRIYNTPKRLSENPDPFRSMEEFDSWHERKIKTGNQQKNEFAIACEKLNGLKLTFDNDLHNRIKNSRKYLNEKRYQIIPQLEDAINNPDEIWSLYDAGRRSDKEMITAFLKFYEQKPFVVIVKSTHDGYIRITSFYELDALTRLSDLRRGVLRYKK